MTAGIAVRDLVLAETAATRGCRQDATRSSRSRRTRPWISIRSGADRVPRVYFSRANTAWLFLALGACASAPRSPGPAGSPGPGPETYEGKAPASGQGHELFWAGSASWEFHSPEEIVERMQRSRVQFVLVPRGEPFTDMERQRSARALWPQSKREHSFPRVVKGPYGPRVVGTDVPPEIAAIAEQAEPAYQAGRYAEAERHYRRILEIQPGFYPALLEIGSCAYRAGDHRTALARYDAAIAGNPLDCRGHFYKANALVELGRIDEAVQAFARALVLSPRHDQLRQGIEERQGQIHRHLRGDLLLPEVMVREDGPDHATIESVSAAHWLAYGRCKALWMMDAGWRREVTGSPEHRFSTQEEMECLSQLLSVYVEHRDETTVRRDPMLDRLVEIVMAGYGSEFVAFELAARQAPHVTLMLDEAQRQSIQELVLKYVLVPAK